MTPVVPFSHYSGPVILILARRPRLFSPLFSLSLSHLLCLSLCFSLHKTSANFASSTNHFPSSSSSPPPPPSRFPLPLLLSLLCPAARQPFSFPSSWSSSFSPTPFLSPTPLPPVSTSLSLVERERERRRKRDNEGRGTRKKEKRKEKEEEGE